MYIWLNFMESSLEVMNKAGSTTKAINETAWRVPGKHCETLHNGSQQRWKNLFQVSSLNIYIFTCTREGQWKSSSDLSRGGRTIIPDMPSPTNPPLQGRESSCGTGLRSCDPPESSELLPGRRKSPGLLGACRPFWVLLCMFCCWCEADFSCS